MSNRLLYGFFENFKASDTLLFIGDRSALVRFASFLRELAETAVVKSVDLIDCDWCESLSGVSVVIAMATPGTSHPSRAEKHSTRIVWSMDNLAAAVSATKIDVLFDVRRGHQY